MNKIICSSIFFAALILPAQENLNTQLGLATNQVGFHPEQFKEVLVSYDKILSDKTFTIIDEQDKVRFSGCLKDFGFDADSGDYVAKGDFTPFREKGTFRVRNGAGLTSFLFTIGETINTPVLKLALRWLYLQRSGPAIDDQVSGIKRPANLTAPAPLWGPKGPIPGKRVDITGGWFDAGDYGRYTSPAATTLMSLFYAWQLRPGIFPDGFSRIPESGNNVSDLLDEIRWELEWLLKMQREDGAVHHKATHTAYSYLMPDQIKEPVYLFDVSTQATAQFTGVMAYAATVFAKIDKPFAARLLGAAEKAWAWLEKTPQKYPVGGFKNPLLPDGVEVTGGPYSVFDRDENELRLWAVASLFYATGRESFQQTLKKLWARRDQKTRIYDMNSLDGYAFAVFTSLNNPKLDKLVRKEMLDTVRDQSETLLQLIEKTGYSVTLSGINPPFDYTWGSTEYVNQRGLYLLLANRHLPDRRYVDGAARQLNWVLGANPLHRCLINGDVGSAPLKTSHHAMSMLLKRSYPGSIGEGPNASNPGDDPALTRLLARKPPPPPAKCLVDDWESYATNEPTIYNNAAFVALAAFFSR
jgi:endoglucanase